MDEKKMEKNVWKCIIYENDDDKKRKERKK